LENIKLYQFNKKFYHRYTILKQMYAVTSPQRQAIQENWNDNFDIYSFLCEV